MRKAAFHDREPTEGASRQQKLMKYTLELRTERQQVGLAGDFLRYMGREHVGVLREGFAENNAARPIRVVPRAIRPFEDEWLF